MTTSSDKLLDPNLSGSIFSKPAYLLAIIFIATFLAESIIMLVLNFLPPLSMEQNILLDSSTLVIIISPALYFLAFNPLKSQIL